MHNLAAFERCSWASAHIHSEPYWVRTWEREIWWRTYR